jgi:hypothetical protein
VRERREKGKGRAKGRKRINERTRIGGEIANKGQGGGEEEEKKKGKRVGLN